MQNNKIFAGINYRGFFGLDNELLIAVTEKLSYEKLDDYAKCLEESIQRDPQFMIFLVKE